MAEDEADLKKGQKKPENYRFDYLHVAGFFSPFLKKNLKNCVSNLDRIEPILYICTPVSAERSLIEKGRKNVRSKVEKIFKVFLAPNKNFSNFASALKDKAPARNPLGGRPGRSEDRSSLTILI